MLCPAVRALLCCAGELDMRRLQQWLGALLQEKGANIYRSKGILAVAGTNDK